MIKEIKYGGVTLTVKVDLNFRVEKRINGKRFHKVSITPDNGLFYLSNVYITDKNLEDSISSLIKLAKNTIGNVDEPSEIKDLLINLGFV
tara:strand:+ start:67 stop:336 length:270 start_codon:yes stop_codon:yes gene_type:complete